MASLKTRCRQNQNRDVTIRKMDAYMAKMRRSGELMFPAERELCIALGCSRCQLREVLDEKATHGEIVQRGRKRSLSISKVNGKKILGRFSYVSYGENMIGNLAWNKLWMRLQPLTESAGIIGELILGGTNSDFDKIVANVANGPETVVLTDTASPDITKRILKLKGKCIIHTDEQYAGSGDNLVTLDNYEVGKTAAEMLAAHGYKKPAFICTNQLKEGALYKMFADRAEGFRFGCRKYGLDFSANSEIWLPPPDELKMIIALVKSAASFRGDAFDSVFLYTDDKIRFFYGALVEEGVKIPDKLGLVTVNSFDYAINHSPKISSVTHATHSVAAKLAEELKNIFVTGNKKIGQHFMKPTFHDGETLCRISNNRISNNRMTNSRMGKLPVTSYQWPVISNQ